MKTIDYENEPNESHRILESTSKLHLFISWLINDYCEETIFFLAIPGIDIRVFLKFIEYRIPSSLLLWFKSLLSELNSYYFWYERNSIISISTIQYMCIVKMK